MIKDLLIFAIVAGLLFVAMNLPQLHLTIDRNMRLALSLVGAFVVVLLLNMGKERFSYVTPMIGYDEPQYIDALSNPENVIQERLPQDLVIPNQEININDVSDESDRTWAFDEVLLELSSPSRININPEEIVMLRSFLYEQPEEGAKIVRKQREEDLKNMKKAHEEYIANLHQELQHNIRLQKQAHEDQKKATRMELEEHKRAVHAQFEEERKQIEQEKHLLNKAAEKVKFNTTEDHKEEKLAEIEHAKSQLAKAEAKHEMNRKAEEVPLKEHEEHVKNLEAHLDKVHQKHIADAERQVSAVKAHLENQRQQHEEQRKAIEEPIIKEAEEKKSSSKEHFGIPSSKFAELKQGSTFYPQEVECFEFNQEIKENKEMMSGCSKCGVPMQYTTWQDFWKAGCM